MAPAAERGGGAGAAAPAARPAPGAADRMDGKLCVVTGANSGIGFEVARGLMARGAQVVMACRNAAACEAACERLRVQQLGGSCGCRLIDLEDHAAIRAFVRQLGEELAAGGPHLGPGAQAAGNGGRGSNGGGGAQRRYVDVLVNNAGVMGVSPAPDGSDRHLAANHLGPYLLTRLLLPHMAPEGARLVNVASRAHFAGALALVRGPPGAEAVRADTRHWWWQYARSKLCNVLFTAELQRRYGGAGVGAAAGAGAGGPPRGVCATAVSPGLVDTGIFRYLLPSWAQWLRTPLRPLFRTAEQGAEVVLYAACSPSLQGSGALFLHDCREMQPSAAARDPALAADLWAVSAALVGLPPEDGAAGGRR